MQVMLTEVGSVEAKVFNGNTYQPAAWKALEFAGSDRRLANLPDIIDARLANPVGTTAWETYLTSTTIEFLGYLNPHNPAIVIAHQAPLEMLARVATSGGFFEQREFDEMLKNLGGLVEIVSLDKLVSLYGTYNRRGFDPYPNAFFRHIMTADEAAENPLVRARFGPRTDEYLLRHQRESRTWAQNEDITNSSLLDIIQVEAVDPLPYQSFIESRKPRAHLLVQSALADMNRGRDQRSLQSDTHYYEYKNDARVIGIRGSGKVNEIQG